jgi:hypothetical protein
MTAARPTTPGITYLLTRRTSQRTLFFRPDADGTMQNIYLYTLGVSAKKFNVGIAAVSLLSDHEHLVPTDRDGVMPDFLHYLHRHVACATQCHRGWGEEIWNGSQTSLVELPTPAIVIDKVSYVVVQPVAAGLVRAVRDWPGVKTRVDEFGRHVFVAKRPDVYFRGKMWPETIELPLELPPSVAEVMSVDEAQQALRERVEEREKEARHESIERFKRGERPQPFLGADKCVKVHFTRRATARETWGKTNPTFADGGDRELRKELIEKKRTFEAEHHDALTRFRDGERDVLFPYGTWRARVVYGALCRPPPGARDEQQAA